MTHKNKHNIDCRLCAGEKGEKEKVSVVGVANLRERDRDRERKTGEKSQVRERKQRSYLH